MVSGLAGRDFVEGFLKRNPMLSLRKPQGVALNRIYGLNRESVSNYFTNLENILDTYKFQAHQIYNCDESGITAVHKPMKVIAPKGKHCVSSATSGEKGVTTTIVCCTSATGNYVPPLMIFKRKRMKPELIDHAPPGTIGGCSDNGWITSELFLTYIKHFRVHVRCSKDQKVLLILDGHVTHTKNIETIDYCRENGIVLLSLPPHTSHKLQPLDRSFFKPLKTAYHTECSRWMREHPGRRITVDQIGAIFSTAYCKATTTQNAVSGFKTSGIVPLNRDVIPDSEYADDARLSVETTLPNVTTAPQSSTLTNTPQSSPVVLSSTPVEEPSSSKAVQFSIETSFENIVPVPNVKMPAKKGEESIIITASPHRNMLEKNLPKKNKIKENMDKKCLKPKKDRGKGKSKAKVKLVLEDWECYVCNGLWSNAKEGEKWVQCVRCVTWCHEECCTFPGGEALCDLC